jgi:hypothetical protein
VQCSEILTWQVPVQGFFKVRYTFKLTIVDQVHWSVSLASETLMCILQYCMYYMSSTMSWASLQYLAMEIPNTLIILQECRVWICLDSQGGSRSQRAKQEKQVEGSKGPTSQNPKPIFPGLLNYCCHMLLRWSSIHLAGLDPFGLWLQQDSNGAGESLARSSSWKETTGSI